jgi:hypothetical protein
MRKMLNSEYNSAQRRNTFEPTLTPPMPFSFTSYDKPFTQTPTAPSLVTNEYGKRDMHRHVGWQYQDYKLIDENAYDTIDTENGLFITRDQRSDVNLNKGAQEYDDFMRGVLTNTQTFKLLRDVENSLSMGNRTISYDPFDYPSKIKKWGLLH